MAIIAAKQASPTQLGASALTAWLKKQAQKTISTSYQRLVRAMQRAYMQGGPAAMDRAYLEALPGITERLDALVRLSIHVAVWVATRTFAAETIEQYGRDVAETVLTAAGEDIAETLVPGVPTELAIKLGGGAPQTVLEKFLTQKDQWGYTYSERIWKNHRKTREELDKAVVAHLQSGKSFLKDAQSLTQFEVHDTTLPRYLQRLERTARQALKGAPQAKQEFLAALAAAKKEAASRVKAPMGTRAFAEKTIRGIEKAVKKGTDEAVTESIGYFIGKRAEYRAVTLLQSEGARAFQLANWETYKQQPFVRAIKVNLNVGHPAPDECDWRARVDIGLGPGVYYKSHLPWPWHPRCICFITAVFAPPEHLGRVGPLEPENPTEYAYYINDVMKVSKSANKAGAKGQDAFNAWFESAKDIPKGYDGLGPKPTVVRAPVPPPAPVSPARPIPSPSPWTKDDILLRHRDIKSLGGSTGARLVEDVDGNQWVAKRPPDPLQSYVEATTNNIYQELGLSAPKSYVTVQNDRIMGVANEFYADAKPITLGKLTKKQANEILDGFVADVLTLNRDAVGLEFDNIMLVGDKIVRIDNGGSLIFRAMGARKPESQWRQILEWDGLPNPDINRQYAAIFKKAGLKSADDLAGRGLKQVEAIQALRVRTNNFNDLFPVLPGIDERDRAMLVSVLQDRADLLQRDIVPRLQAQVARPKPKRMPKPKAPAQQVAFVPEPGTYTGLLHDDELAAIGNARQNGFTLVRDRDDIESHSVMVWYDKDAGGESRTRILLKARGPAEERMDGISAQWDRKTYAITGSTIDKGMAQDTDRVVWNQGTMREQEIGGVRIRYFDDRFNNWALYGRIEIAIPGSGRESVERGMRSLESLGFNIDTPSAMQREHLYMTQIVSSIHTRERHAGWEALRTRMARQTPDAQIAEMQAWVQSELGLSKPITQYAGYNPNGERMAFGNGERLLMRPDLDVKDNPAWKKFAGRYAIYHENTSSSSLSEIIDRILGSGGQMASTTDKARRGIRPGGMSPQRDFETGGADYFFTRIVAKSRKSEGFYWRANALRRLDAISYDDDYFGRTLGDHVSRHRQEGVDAWARISKKRGNETIFKHGISLFDDLERIVVRSEEERQRVIDVFKKHGIMEWPDGRPLEKIVVAG